MQKTYVLDTNVLIQAPYALESFEDNHIVLPLAVLEELDGLKRAEGERGSNARQVIRFLERLRLQGNLIDGVPLPGGGQLRLEINHVGVTLPDGMDPESRDNRILKVCKGLLEEGTPAILGHTGYRGPHQVPDDGGDGGGLYHRPGALRQKGLRRPGRVLCAQ